MTEPYSSRAAAGPRYVTKADVLGRMVLISDSRWEDRGLELIVQRSRAVSAHAPQELVTCCDPDAGPGKVVDRVAYLGFMEVLNSGVIVVGDAVTIDGEPFGWVVGFDESHAPNHFNVVIRGARLATGAELGLNVGTPIRFSVPEPPGSNPGST